MKKGKFISTDLNPWRRCRGKLRKKKNQVPKFQTAFISEADGAAEHPTPASVLSVFQGCILFPQKQAGWTMSGRTDGPTMSAIPSSRVAALPPIRRSGLHNEAQRQGEEEEEEEGSGCGQMPATPSFPKARVLNAHQHTHTPLLSLKGLPLCGR